MATYEDYEALFERLLAKQEERKAEADIDAVLRIVEQHRTAEAILRAEDMARRRLDPDVYVRIVNATPSIHETSVPATPRVNDDTMSNYTMLVAIIMVLSLLLTVLFTVFCL